MSNAKFKSLDEALPHIIAAARLGYTRGGRRTIESFDLYSAAQRVGYAERISSRELGRVMKDAKAERVTNGLRGAKYALPDSLIPKEPE